MNDQPKPIRIGIAIDPWKLTIFKRRLDEAGFKYETHLSVADSVLLKVVTADKEGLRDVVQAANTEAARVGKQSGA